MATKKPAKPPVVVNRRDAKDGKFVSKERVKRDPGGTTTERNPRKK